MTAIPPFSDLAHPFPSLQARQVEVDVLHHERMGCSWEGVSTVKHWTSQSSAGATFAVMYRYSGAWKLLKT